MLRFGTSGVPLSSARPTTEHGIRRARRTHGHVSGIEFGPRGERRHKRLRESGFRWLELLRALKDLRVSGWVVNETPGMEEDAMLLRDTWRSLR